MIAVQPAAKVQTKRTVSSRRGRSACGPPLATYGLIRSGSPGAALVGDAEHAFARSGVLQSRRRRQGRRRRVPRAHAPRGAEAFTRAPRRVRGPPPRQRPQCEIAIAPHRRPAAHRERKQERKGLVLEGRRDLTDGGKSGERYGRRLVAPQAAGMEQAEEMKTANGDGEEDGGRPFRSFEHRRGFDAAMLARRRGGLPRPAAPL